MVVDLGGKLMFRFNKDSKRKLFKKFKVWKERKLNLLNYL